MWFGEAKTYCRFVAWLLVTLMKAFGKPFVIIVFCIFDSRAPISFVRGVAVRDPVQVTTNELLAL